MLRTNASQNADQPADFRIPRTTLALLVLLVLFSPVSATADIERGAWEVEFKLSNGYLIVVEGEVKGRTVRLLVDTGATYSMIDSRIAEQLDLRTVSQAADYAAFGKKSDSRLVVLPGVRMGDVVASLLCFTADLGWTGVDGVIGLDLIRRRDFLVNAVSGEVLRARSFGIDYERQVIFFAPRAALSSSTSISDDPAQLVVDVRVEGRDLKLAVDTGARRMNVFVDPRGERWTRRLRVQRHFTVTHLGSRRRVPGVTFSSVQLGDSEWSGYLGIVQDIEPGATDGVIGIASLGLKRLYFDFDNNIMSWGR